MFVDYPYKKSNNLFLLNQFYTDMCYLLTAMYKFILKPS